MNERERKAIADYFQARYPQLFSNRGKKNSAMNGGVWINAGWFLLLEEICVKLHELLHSFPNLQFVQIKEKFGRLTVYIEGINDTDSSTKVHNLIEEICNRSLKTCEFCGATEGVTLDASGGCWLRSLCKKCHSEVPRNNDIKKARALLEKIVAENEYT